MHLGFMALGPQDYNFAQSNGTTPEVCCKTRGIMGSPQDARGQRRKRLRRAKKNVKWELDRARENSEAAKPKAKPKTAT